MPHAFGYGHRRLDVISVLPRKCELIDAVLQMVCVCAAACRVRRFVRRSVSHQKKEKKPATTLPCIFAVIYCRFWPWPIDKLAPAPAQHPSKQHATPLIQYLAGDWSMKRFSYGNGGDANSIARVSLSVYGRPRRVWFPLRRCSFAPFRTKCEKASARNPTTFLRNSRIVTP